MLQPLMYEAVHRERERELERMQQAQYVRRLMLARRRQRKADAARRALAITVVR